MAHGLVRNVPGSRETTGGKPDPMGRTSLAPRTVSISTAIGCRRRGDRRHLRPRGRAVAAKPRPAPVQVPALDTRVRRPEQSRAPKKWPTRIIGCVRSSASSRSMRPRRTLYASRPILRRVVGLADAGTVVGAARRRLRHALEDGGQLHPRLTLAPDVDDGGGRGRARARARAGHLAHTRYSPM